jgi:hypothetical protein
MLSCGWLRHRSTASWTLTLIIARPIRLRLDLRVGRTRWGRRLSAIGHIGTRRRRPRWCLLLLLLLRVLRI